MAVSQRLCFAAALAAFFLPILSLVVSAQVPPIRRPPLIEPRTELTSRLTIEQKYAALGGAGGVLGAARSPEGALPDRTGRYRIYANGVILWHPDTGAHELQGPILQKFRSFSPAATPGGPRYLAASLAMFGYPTSGQRSTEDARGVYNAFQRGVIYLITDRPSIFDPSRGAREIHGDIYEKWRTLFHAGLDLGYPLTDQRATPDGRGRFNHFERGSIYATHETGVREIHGAIREKWEQTGWERGPLGYPTTDVREEGGVSTTRFEHGMIQTRVRTAPLTFFQQNMALLVAPAGYKGTERNRAIEALIDNLRREQPDVVGLSECFADGERATIKGQLAAIYPHTAEGPDENDLESDGGLLILSRHPILDRNQSVYRHCRGEDCLANKGVLHARIEPRGHPTAYDVFLSHLQSENPEYPILGNVGTGSTAVEKIQRQLTHLNGFVRGLSSPQRPAVILGDLNTDGFERARYNDLLTRLQHPRDIWLEIGSGRGTTFDDVNSFKSERRPLPVADPTRHRSGERFDYFLVYPGERFNPNFSDAQVVVLQSSPGRDISDHYGLRVRQTEVTETSMDVSRPVGRVQISLEDFHCLKATVGPTGIASERTSDEVEFQLRVMTAAGTTRSGVRRFNEVYNGDRRTFSPPLAVGLATAGESVDIEVEGWEVDPVTVPVAGEVGSTGRASLGSPNLRLTRRELMELWGRSTTRALPLRRAEGEYVVTVRIAVTAPVEVRRPR